MSERGIAALLALCAGACSAPCAKGDGVLLTLAGDAQLFAGATQLELALSVDGTPVAQPPQPLAGTFSSGMTVLLQPSAPPKMDSYELGVVATLEDADDAAIASASVTLSAGAHACNRGSLSFAAPSSLDGSATEDGGDLAPPIGNGGIGGSDRTRRGRLGSGRLDRLGGRRGDRGRRPGGLRPRGSPDDPALGAEHGG